MITIVDEENKIKIKIILQQKKYIFRCRVFHLDFTGKASIRKSIEY